MWPQEITALNVCSSLGQILTDLHNSFTAGVTTEFTLPRCDVHYRSAGICIGKGKLNVHLSVDYYAALLPRRGPHIASHSVCLSVCPSVPCLFTLEHRSRVFVNLADVRYLLFTFAPSYERTPKIEKLRFSLMGQCHVCTFRHAQRAAYRTAISAAQILV